jgi:predicted metal-dependent peptidase
MATTSFEERLEKIRVQFLFDHPFLSVLAISLPSIYQKNLHELFETDGAKIYIDESKAVNYDDDRLKYQYAHTLLHILLKHAFRIGERDRGLWNRSCDIVINLLLEDFDRVGKRPEDEVLLEKFRDKSVEEVYNALYEESNQDGENDDDEKTEEKVDLLPNPKDEEHHEEEIDALIIQAIGAAKKQGNLPSSLDELINEVTKPKIDLFTLLHAYISESFFDKNVDFCRPNRRFIHQDIYLPGFKYEKNRLEVTIALDRSMSISRQIFSKFLGIIDAILRISSDFEVEVVPFDEKIYPEMITRYDAQSIKKEVAFSKGNGGTLFDPILEYVESMHTMEARRLLIVLSDGFFRIEKSPPIETIFLISEKKNLSRFRDYGTPIQFDL